MNCKPIAVMSCLYSQSKRKVTEIEMNQSLKENITEPSESR